MTLNQNQVVALLKVATAYDGRERGRADILAWSDSAERAQWTYEEALEAVKEHFAFDGGFLNPAAVTKRVTANREARAKAVREARFEEFQRELEAPPGKPAAEPEWFKPLLAETARKLGWPTAPKPKQEALEVECPHCHAAPGRPCARRITRGPRTGEYKPLSNCHDSRIQASKRQAA